MSINFLTWRTFFPCKYFSRSRSLSQPISSSYLAKSLWTKLCGDNVNSAPIVREAERSDTLCIEKNNLKVINIRIHESCQWKYKYTKSENISIINNNNRMKTIINRNVQRSLQAHRNSIYQFLTYYEKISKQYAAIFEENSKFAYSSAHYIQVAKNDYI